MAAGGALQHVFGDGAGQQAFFLRAVELEHDVPVRVGLIDDQIDLGTGELALGVGQCQALGVQARALGERLGSLARDGLRDGDVRRLRRLGAERQAQADGHQERKAEDPEHVAGLAQELADARFDQLFERVGRLRFSRSWRGSFRLRAGFAVFERPAREMQEHVVERRLVGAEADWRHLLPL